MTLIAPPMASEPYIVEPEPSQHFDLRDGIQRHGDIHVVMAGLRVVQPHAVQQHQRLGVAGAANRKVVLNAIGRAGFADRWTDPAEGRPPGC